MKKAIIYYFSGSGNTLKVCRLMKSAMESMGVETLLSDMANKSEINNPTDFEYIGIAYPIHAFNAPYIVLDFAKKMPTANAKKYFILKTSGEPLKINNISSLKLNDILRKKGYILSFEKHYVMPYNMIFRHTDDMAYKMLEAVKISVPYDAKNIIDENERLLDKILFGKMIAYAFRIEHIAMKINGKHFKVNKTKCIGCKKCEQNCPVNNIYIDENGNFAFDNRCLMCTKCSFSCPTDAFSIGILNNWRVNGKYNFEKPQKEEINKHKRYCKKSYEKYFENMEKYDKTIKICDIMSNGENV